MTRDRTPLWLQPADSAWTPAYRRLVRRRCWVALVLASALFVALLVEALS